MARVLVIEDDSGMRHMLETTLRAAGHQVQTAREGREGITEHLARPVELIVTDIFMPGMEGMETIRTLRRDDKVVKILAITGLADLGNPLAAARIFGADRTLEKPFQPHEFLAAVQDTLNSRP
jgi:DNA-binding response OmpR family regulator